MTKGEKAMGEALKRVAKECRNDDMRTQMNKIKKEFLGKRGYWGTQVMHAHFVTMAHEEKPKSGLCEQ